MVTAPVRGDGHDVARALAAELAAVVEGETRFDSGTRAAYSYDASVFRQTPIGVVIPRHDRDVEAALEACRRHSVPALARGCGTALAGQSVNTAVVFDFSKYMNQLVDLDPEARTARNRIALQMVKDMLDYSSFVVRRFTWLGGAWRSRRASRTGGRWQVA
jgi:hypothetical protein